MSSVDSAVSELSRTPSDSLAWVEGNSPADVGISDRSIGSNSPVREARSCSASSACANSGNARSLLSGAASGGGRSRIASNSMVRSGPAG